MSIADRYAAAQRAALTSVAEAAILDGTSTAAEAAGPALEDIAAAHAEGQRVHRYLDAAEAEARASHRRIQAAFNDDPSEVMLQSLTYYEGILHAVATARRILRLPHPPQTSPGGVGPWQPVFKMAMQYIAAALTPASPVKP